MRGTPLSDLALVCLLVLLCTRSTPVSGRLRRSRNVASTFFSTVLLQQAAWRVVLRSVRGCVHALSHVSHCRFLPVPRSVPWPDRCVDDLLRVRPLFSHRFPPDCPSSHRFASRNQNVLAEVHPETDEYARFHPVFGLCMYSDFAFLLGPPRSKLTTLHSRATPSLLTSLMVWPSSATQTLGLRPAGENPAFCWLRLF